MDSEVRRGAKRCDTPFKDAARVSPFIRRGDRVEVQRRSILTGQVHTTEAPLVVRCPWSRHREENLVSHTGDSVGRRGDARGEQRLIA